MEKITLCAVTRDGLRMEETREFMTRARREKNAVMRNQDALELSACTELALSMALRQRGLPPREYRYGENGKPFFPEGPYLSLCHGGDAGFAVLSKWPVGFDAEKQDRDASRVEKRIRAAGEDGTALELWTGKEAYLKLTGEGLSVPMAELTIRDGCVFRGGQKEAWLLRPEIPGYVTALASEREVSAEVYIFSAKEALRLLKTGRKYDTMT